MRAALAIVAAVAAAACGDNASLVDDASCTAAFSGNFAATTTGSGDCARLSGSAGNDVQLELSLAAGVGLDAPLAVSIALGRAPAPGELSSETASAWSALGLHAAGSGECVYSAGTDGVPTGSFALTLDAIDVATGVAHGTLTIMQYVQAQPGIDCGAGDTENVDATF